MSARPEFRKSQGVVPFGVGAIIDFADESLMSAGLDVWPIESAEGGARAAMLESCQVLDGRLARRLSIELGRRIEHFLTPTEAPEFGSYGMQVRPDRAPMPFVRFPNWYFCPRCRALKRLPWNSTSGSDTLKCSNMDRRLEGNGEVCGALKSFRRPALSPVRFVAACENGHIMDFPWSAWAHEKTNVACSEPDDHLYLFSTTAAGLAGVMVGCTNCHATRSMAGAFQRNALSNIYGGGCPGERPWLGPGGVQNCANKIPQTIQRGASNAYFAKVVSSILIPPYSAQIQQILDRPEVWSEIEVMPLVDGKLYEPLIRKKAENLGIDPAAFMRAIEERLSAAKEVDAEPQDNDASEIRYRYDEYKAYTGPRPPKQERHDFDIQPVSSNAYAPWFEDFFEQVVLVTRLRETRALTGFSRLVPVEALTGAMSEMSIQPKRWLPGFSVRGEGIFLKFNARSLAAWRSRAEVLSRAAILQNRLDKLKSERDLQRRLISADLILIHSFAHLLIRQLAFECGYDASSIRERLYVSDESEMTMAGLLLYTASGDSEGTLGGLVRQGEPGRLDNTIAAALRNGAICSSDPLCIESNGQGTYSLNLASCHACGLLPETSCEEGNLLLDRVMALGTPTQPSVGYFEHLST